MPNQIANRAEVLSILLVTMLAIDAGCARNLSGLSIFC